MSNREKSDDIAGAEFAGVESVGVESAGSEWGGVGGRPTLRPSLDLQFALDKTLTARKGPTPVFVRGSGATFVDSDKLVKYAPENLMLQSENLSTSWSGVGRTISSDFAIAPNGTMTADKLVESATSGLHGTFQVPTTIAGMSYTGSFYVKAAGRNFAVIYTGASPANGRYISIPPDGTGTVLGLYNATPSSVTMQYVGDGWYRVSIAILSTGAGTSLEVYAAISGTNNSYTGDGTSGILVWGAQLERSSTARTYNPTTTAAFYGPRFDHDSVTGVCKGLLMEEQRTNAAWYSGAIVQNTGWTGGATSTVGGTGPDGSPSYQISEVVTSNIQSIANTGGAAALQGTSVVSGTTYTGSIFVKKVAGSIDWVQVTFGGSGFGATQYANFDIGSGTVGNFTGLASGTSPRIENYGNGWYRVSISVTASATVPSNNIILAFTQNTNVSVRLPPYAGNTSNSFLAAMCQFETGAFPTSYIPTVAASAIRSADTCSITGSAFSGFYNAAGGTVTTSQIVNTTSGTTSPEACRITGTGGQLQFGTTNATTEALRFYSINGANLKKLATGTRTSGVPFKTAVAFGNNDLAACLDGGTVLTDTTSHTIIIGTSMIIGQTPANIQIAYIRYYKKRLPNAKLQALTV